MNKWQYKILDSKQAEGGGFLKGRALPDFEAYLNTLGSEGWEVISLDFKTEFLGRTEPGASFFGVAKRQAS